MDEWMPENVDDQQDKEARRQGIPLQNTAVGIERFCKSVAGRDCCGGTMIQLHNIRDNRVRNTVVHEDFQIGAASTRLEDPSKKRTKRTAKSKPINPCPSREGPYSTFFSVSRPMEPSCGWRGFWPYRGMSRRIPDRQPRLGLATCVRQK